MCKSSICIYHHIFVSIALTDNSREHRIHSPHKRLMSRSYIYKYIYIYHCDLSRNDEPTIGCLKVTKTLLKSCLCLIHTCSILFSLKPSVLHLSWTFIHSSIKYNNKSIQFNGWVCCWTVFVFEQEWFM